LKIFRYFCQQIPTSKNNKRGLKNFYAIIQTCIRFLCSLAKITCYLSSEHLIAKSNRS